ncbi:MAG: CPBP family intramembrane metalloprotease [Tagaea sp.]|nr:CPBP family intramembrane metalloprotease [Tagaea sp.]
MRQNRALWALFVAALLVGLGNDFVFAAIESPWPFYAFDWAVKGAILATVIALGGLARPAGVPNDVDPGKAFSWIAGLGAAIFAMALLQLWMPEGARIFDSPRYGSTMLAILDGTLGLALSAAAEEGIFRVLALRLFGPAGWFVPTAAFAAIHWGAGWPSVAVAFAAGALLWIAYRRTGSFFVVTCAHYLGNLATYVLLR